MRNKHNMGTGTRGKILQDHKPFLANGTIPVVLLHAHKRRVGLFPTALPMFRVGVTDAWKYENG